MGLEDKIKNEKDKLVGKGKEKYGEATNNPGMENEGTAQKTKGKIGSATEKAKDKVQDAFE